MSVVERQIAQAKQSIILLKKQVNGVESSITRQKTIVEQNRTDGSGHKIEVRLARQAASTAASAEISRLTLLKNQLLENIADLEKFISLDSELKRAQDLNAEITTIRDSEIFASREKQELSAESRRILAAFEEAKKERVNSNDAQRLADQLAIERARAETEIFNILNPAIAERNRREEEARIQQENLDAFNARVQEQNKFFLDEQEKKRLADLQARFDNLPLDEFIAKVNAERAAAAVAEEKEIQNEIERVAEQLKTKDTDENAKIRDALDNIVKSIFGTPTTEQQKSGGIDEEVLAKAYAKSTNVEIDDLIEAAFMQEEAAAEIAALKGIEVR